MIAPLQLLQRCKAMFHDRLSDAIVQRAHITRHAKGAILLSAPRPSGDLRQLVRCQGPHPPAVEFGQRRKRDMINVQVQPHSDGIRGHQKINLAVLVHVDLRIAGARAERAHDHGRPTLLPTDQFGDGVNVVDRKPDNGRARAHPADFLLARIDQLRHPLAAHVLRLGHKGRDRAAHGVRAQKQRLVQAARPQQAVGKDVAPFRIGAELDFIHGQKIDAHPFGHRLDGADPILGARRHDPFFARNQGHDGRAAQGHDTVIDFTRQQAQRQTDHTCPVPQHPVDGIGGLTCVGRAQNGHNPCVARHGQSPNFCSELAAYAVGFQSLKRIAGVFVMGIQVDDPGKGLFGAI